MRSSVLSFNFFKLLSIGLSIFDFDPKKRNLRGFAGKKNSTLTPSDPNNPNIFIIAHSVNIEKINFYL